MSGTLIDLVSKGIQDTYLSGTPDTTFFRQVYKRHANFAMEPVRQVIEGEIATNQWSEVSVSRSGDLLTDLYFLGRATGNTAINNPFDEVQLYIGGQMIDSMTAAENTATAQMFRPTFSSNALTPYFSFGTKGAISLQFFFGRGFANALPLLALQYHEVKIRIKWSSTAPLDTFEFYGDYVQLDSAERTKIAAQPVLMLIEQHQRVPLTTITAGVTNYTSLEFSHPVKAIYGETLNTNEQTVLPEDCFMKIEINGKERVPMMPCFNYFQDHQMGKHTEHSATEFGPMYSFALYPHRLVPTGSCNFSRLDNARLVIQGITTAEASGFIYAINWNFLQISKGTGGLLFAN
jgi:hypothetical protein